MKCTHNTFQGCSYIEGRIHYTENECGILMSMCIQCRFTKKNVILFKLKIVDFMKY